MNEHSILVFVNNLQSLNVVVNYYKLKFLKITGFFADHGIFCKSQDFLQISGFFFTGLLKRLRGYYNTKNPRKFVDENKLHEGLFWRVDVAWMTSS